MGEYNDYDELDFDLERLFESMDDVVASDELKQSTMDAVFAKIDEEEERPFLRLVEDDSEEEQATAPKKQKVARRNTSKWWLRVAAIVVVVTLFTAGGIAYAVPATHVIVSAEDETFDLGVNMFGMTVSATANTEEGKAAIHDTRVHNIGFKESLQNLLDAYQKRVARDPNSMTVTVRGRPDDEKVFEDEAQKVMNDIWGAKPEQDNPPEEDNHAEQDRPDEQDTPMEQGDQPQQNILPEQDGYEEQQMQEREQTGEPVPDEGERQDYPGGVWEQNPSDDGREDNDRMESQEMLQEDAHEPMYEQMR